jgi:hypothetical protein
MPQIGRWTAWVGGVSATSEAHAEPAKALVKADRMQPVRPASAVAAPATVEIVGLGPATVILRDRTGNVLYRTDVAANTTTAAKDADLPVVTVKERVESPVARQPSPTVGSSEGRMKTGCEGLVSSLVAHEVRRIPSRCTADAGPIGRPVQLAMN